MKERKERDSSTQAEVALFGLAYRNARPDICESSTSAFSCDRRAAAPNGVRRVAGEQLSGCAVAAAAHLLRDRQIEIEACRRRYGHAVTSFAVASASRCRGRMRNSFRLYSFSASVGDGLQSRRSAASLGPLRSSREALRDATGLASSRAPGGCERHVERRSSSDDLSRGQKPFGLQALHRGDSVPSRLQPLAEPADGDTASPTDQPHQVLCG